MRGPFASVVLVFIGGCGPAVGTNATTGTSSGGPAVTSSGVSTGTTDDTVSTSSSGMTTTSGSTAGPGTSTTTTDESSSTSGRPLDYCDGLPRRTSMVLQVDEDLPPDVAVTQIDAPCLVAEIASKGAEYVLYRLECEEGEPEPVERVLDVRSFEGEARPLVPGETVRFRTFRNYPIDYGLVSVVLLTTLEGELLGGDYQWPPPLLPDEVAAWFDVTLEAIPSDCATLEPDEPGGSFITDPCPRYSTRVGSSVQWGDDSVSLAPGARATVGGLVYTSSLSDLDYVDDEGCPADGLRGAVSFYRPRR